MDEKVTHSLPDRRTGQRTYFRHFANALRTGLCGAPLFVFSRVDLAHAQEHENETAPRGQSEESSDEELHQFMKQEFESNTTNRQRALGHESRIVADRVEKVLQGFVEIGGYFRAGYGRDTRGGPLQPFQAPGASSKYRLGNEAENYGELIFGKNMYLPGIFHVDEELRPDGDPKGPIARVQVRLSFYNPYRAHSSAASTQVGLPEAWAAIGNVIEAQPSAKFWAGNRFYRRHDIHVTDFYFWNMSGGGGGVEDIQVGPAKLALSWIGLGSTSGLSYLPEPDPENEAGFSKSNLELRVYELPLLSGTAEMGLVFAYAQSGLDRDGNRQENTAGMSFNFVHTTPRFLSEDGMNKLSLQYGTGPAKTFTSGFETIAIDGATFIRPDPEGSWRARLTEHFVASPSRYFSVGPVFVVEATKYQPGRGNQYWISAGLRPILHANQYIGLAVEGGMDWVKNEHEKTEGTLYKLTLAPQVSVGRLFNSRPSIRAFVTFARWTNDFSGRVGGLDYANANSGINWGMQMESWW